MSAQQPVMLTLFTRIPARKIAFLKFITEGYDGLAVVTTVNREKGLLALSYFPARRDELISLLESLQPVLTEYANI
jgi:hypothetical protein